MHCNAGGGREQEWPNICLPKPNRSKHGMYCALIKMRRTLNPCFEYSYPLSDALSDLQEYIELLDMREEASNKKISEHLHSRSS